MWAAFFIECHGLASMALILRAQPQRHDSMSKAHTLCSVYQNPSLGTLFLQAPSMQDKPMPHPMRAIQTEEKAMKELSVKYGVGNVRLAKGEDSAQR